MSRPRGHREPAPRSRVQDAGHPPVRRQCPQRRVLELRRFGADRDVADVRAVLQAMADVECRVVRLEVAGADLLERRGDRVAHASRQRVVAAEPESARRPALNREFQRPVVLLPHVVVKIDRAELRRHRVCQEEGAALLEIAGHGT
jgi:hypothetical protein